MTRRSIPTILTLLLIATLTSPAAAAGPRTLRVQMYNSSAVAESKCFILGMKADQPYRRTLKTFKHKARNAKKVYTYDVPAQYVRVDVMCKANGPTATNSIEIARFPLDTIWIKASCPSSQPDSLCTVNQYGGEPDN